MIQLEKPVAQVNKEFDPKVHSALVHTPAFEGNALCVMCAHVKPFTEFQSDAVLKWTTSDNPHRTSICKGCSDQVIKVSVKGMFFHLKRMLRLV